MRVCLRMNVSLYVCMCVRACGARAIQTHLRLPESEFPRTLLKGRRGRFLDLGPGDQRARAIGPSRAVGELADDLGELASLATNPLTQQKHLNIKQTNTRKRAGSLSPSRREGPFCKPRLAESGTESISSGCSPVRLLVLKRAQILARARGILS